MNDKIDGRSRGEGRLCRGLVTRATATAIVVAALVVGAGVAPAFAAIVVSADGATGVVGALTSVRCQSSVYNGPTDVYITQGPVIHAIDARPGSGNDWSWVRYRYRIVGAFGITLAQSNPTNFYSVWDNNNVAPASFTMHSPHWNFVVLVDIEWWNATTRLGGVTLQYGTYYSSYTGWNAPTATC